MSNLFNWHSSDRVNDYKKYVKDSNNAEQIEQLYWLNQRLSIFLYHVIANCELALRNKINDYLIKQHGVDWYNNFDCIEKEVNSAKTKISKKQKNETIGRIVSELSFGAWTKILKHYKKEKDYNFYMGIFNVTNTNNTDKVVAEINKFYGKCDSIRILRNRCVHHENIIKDISKLEKHYESILDILTLIHQKDYRNTVLKEVNKSYNINNSNPYTVFNKLITEINLYRKYK
jgi:hypothetical protein